MKVENFISKVLFKAAPMEPAEYNSLQQDMAVWFSQQKTMVSDKETAAKAADVPVVLTLKDKAFKFIDQWYVRAFFAMAYIFVIRWVQDFINPADPDEEYPEGDDILAPRR